MMMMKLLLPMKMMKHQRQRLCGILPSLVQSISLRHRKGQSDRRGPTGSSGRQCEAADRALMCLLDGFLSLTEAGEARSARIPRRSTWLPHEPRRRAGKRCSATLRIRPSTKPQRLFTIQTSPDRTRGAASHRRG